MVISDEVVIAGSLYKKNNELEPTIDPHVPQHLIDNIEQEIIPDIMSDGGWTPDRIFVMDIGANVNGRLTLYGIIELNSICCSGWYACDPKPIISEMSRIALEEWKNINEML